jgi:single-stranded DNA-binding protein
MSEQNLPHGTGLGCSVTGTVIGKPLYRMVKNGTVPMLGATLRYDEYDGSTSICRTTLFGDRAQEVANRIKTGTRIRVEGTGTVNTWEKDGEKRHGLAILARRIKVEDDGGEGSSDAAYAGREDNSTRHFQPPRRIAPPVENNGIDVF